MSRAIAWTIAGSDSSANAGIQADIKTFTSLGVHGCTVITSVTAQNNKQLIDIQYVDIEPQIKILQTEYFPQAIKIGMLGKNSIIQSVVQFLQHTTIPVILDPVLLTTSNFPLYSDPDYHIILQSLFPYVELLTPNISEAEMFLNRGIATYDEIEQAAADILLLGVKSVLIKGGHFANDAFSQDFWTDGVDAFWLTSPRLAQGNFSGTGCTLSSAITAARALNFDLKDAIVIGKMVINQALHNTMLCWPENQDYLPYLSKRPLSVKPQPFAQCENIGLYPMVENAQWLNRLLPLGVKTIQLRIKDKQGDALRYEIQLAISIAQQFDAQLFINDYWELALELGAYGVHLGQSDLENADIDRLRRAGIRLGVSTHNYTEVATAHALNPSYIAFGAIYPTTLKKMIPQGIEKLKRWRKTLNYPLVAIGGINLERVRTILATGVNGVAMISAITQALEPEIATKKLLNTINSNSLSQDEITRYVQQIKLSNIGLKGQTKLKNAKVLCVGAGGLAAPLLLYLTAAGVGTIGIVDEDEVELSNLQRQILFSTANIGSNKAWSAQQQLSALNPHVQIKIYPESLKKANASEIISRYHIVADCTDNFASKYLINDTCLVLKKPFVYASVAEYSGQCAMFANVTGPCLRCLFPHQPTTEDIPSCRRGGVLGSIPGLLGVIQATEILKWLLNIGNPLTGRLLTIDALTMHIKEYILSRDIECRQHCCIHKELNVYASQSLPPTLFDPPTLLF